MTDRVLSTDKARTAITQMQSILSSQFEGTVQSLLNVGQTLSDPNVWDGQVASNFRINLWPQVSKGLQQALTGMQQLQLQISRINQNIMTAGGNQ